ncbi:DNA replication protein, partial [Niallia circulans]
HYIGSLQRSRQALQQPAYMLDVNAWQTLFNEFNRSNIPADIGEEASRQYYRQMQAAKTAPFAVLDDIGVRNATEAFRGDLHAVINARVTNGLPTVYTSNLPLAEMERVFDARLYDRMRDQCAELVFVGGSKRGMRK